MRKNPTITMNHIQTAASTFEDFLRTKRTNGVKTKSLETYAQHFRSISKHLDTTVDITKITEKDLNDMILSMEKSGFLPF